MVYSFQERSVKVLEESIVASHYAWDGNENILLTAVLNTKYDCAYFNYNVHTGERTQVCSQVLHRDGHPTIFGNKILTDTYPLRGYQHLMFVDRATEQVADFAQIMTTYKHRGERRTDLHPRLDTQSGVVCVDCNMSGRRQMLLMDVKYLIV